MAEYDHRFVRGSRVELLVQGSGPPVLFLNAGYGLDFEGATLVHLSRRARVIAPSHPGFGGSDRPDFVTTVDDISYLYLNLLDELNLQEVTLVGVSFGAWIAAEMAVKSTARLSRLVMANAVGIKVGDRETRDIADVFAMTEPELAAATFANPSLGTRDYKAMSDSDLLAVTRNRETLARFAWSPYMHNPKLKNRLHRIGVPTLFLWGEADGIVSSDYGRAFSAEVPGSRFELIEGAGHLPHVETPVVFAEKVLQFMENDRIAPQLGDVHESLSFYRATLSRCLGQQRNNTTGDLSE